MAKLSTGVLWGALIVAGCSDQYKMVTAALMTDPESTGVETEGGSTGGTAQLPTSGGPTADTDNDPTADTTGAPATCDTPEACTGEGAGDVGPLTLPFFRGRVCVSEAVKPGDAVAVSISSCVHPCLDVNGFKFTTAFRGADGGVEMALAYYHKDVTGTACPPDVFGEFPPEACVFTTPKTLGVGPVSAKDGPFVGAGTFMVPFFTNDDVAAFAGGDDTQEAVWQRVASHTQASDRVFDVSFDDGNPAAPAACGEDVAGCSCRSIGL